MRRGLLFIDQHAGLGGGQRLLHSIATAPSIRETWDVRVALPEVGWFSESLAAADIPVLQFAGSRIRSGRKNLLDILNYVKSFLRQALLFRRLIREGDAEFVYMSSPRCLFQAICAALRLDTRIIFHVQCFYGGQPSQWFLRTILRASKVACIVAPSVEAEEWMRSLVGSRKQVVRIPNWLTIAADLDTHPTRAAGGVLPSGSPSSFRFGVVGRVAPIKGQDVFLEAARRLLGRGMDLEFYVIGGSDYTEDPSYEMVLREKYHHEPRIHFLGPVTDIGPIYRELSCVVVPSRSEIFPLVVLEAMYFGIPVIVADVGELPLLVASANCGLVFHRESVDELTSAMNTVVCDNELRCRLSEKGQRYVRQHCLLEAGVRRIYELLVYLRTGSAVTPARGES